MVFVAWNKVITVQYFHWYLCLLPLVLAQSTLSARAWLGSFLVWLLAEVRGSCTQRAAILFAILLHL